MIAVAAPESLRYFAEMLTYPSSSLLDTARACATSVEPGNPAAGEFLREFSSFVEETSLSRLEESYTGLFDLDPKCYLYVGYHILGENYKRSVFLLGLKERYQACGFEYDDELPDHLNVMLRFLATTDDAEMAQELIADAVLPAIDKMTGRSKSAGLEEHAEGPPLPENPRKRAPYFNVLEALRMVLLDMSPETPLPAQ